MAINITKIDAKIEKSIVIGAIISDQFLTSIAPTTNLDFIETPYLKQIMKWCLKYYSKYGKAPSRDIENIYNSWSSKTKAPQDTILDVEEVLTTISEEYEQSEALNVSYLLDITHRHFATMRVKLLKDELEYSLLHDDIKTAETSIMGFNSIVSEIEDVVDPLNNEECWDDAYAEAAKPLILFENDAMDKFFKHALAPNNLIGILAPEKRGKTYWCLEFVIQALKNRRKVALFEVGDMSRNQVLRRIGSRMTGRPQFKVEASQTVYPYKIANVQGTIRVKTKKIDSKELAEPSFIKKMVNKFKRHYGLPSKTPFLKISTHSSESVNVADIRNILKKWRLTENYIPEVIIIDYPDILAPEPNTYRFEKREQINSTWKALRRLSQDLHTLVIVPTQADAQSYDARLIRKSNFSGDKRKFAHVTGMFALNQDDDEKLANIVRLNWVVLREGMFSETQIIHVGQCLSLGKAFTCACWG